MWFCFDFPGDSQEASDITSKVKIAYGDNTWFSEDLLCRGFFKIETLHPAWKFLKTERK